MVFQFRENKTIRFSDAKIHFICFQESIFEFKLEK